VGYTPIIFLRVKLLSSIMENDRTKSKIKTKCLERFYLFYLAGCDNYEDAVKYFKENKQKLSRRTIYDYLLVAERLRDGLKEKKK
jgi:hypothetical protein